jgi:hypothetical protein
VYFERGVNDRGIRGGAGTFGFDTLLGHVDWIHDQGRHFVFAASARSAQDREYGLAAYFLLGNGNDAVSNVRGGTPDRRWWTAYDRSLGEPLGARYAWQGVLRRDFELGIVLVNPPEAPRAKIMLPEAYRTWNGRLRRSVRLRPASGAVLWRDPA